jgi:serine protease Do
MRVSTLLLLSLGAGGSGDEVEAWVRARLAAQRGQTAPLSPAPALWRERAPGAPAVIPGFQPPTSLAPLVKAVRPGVVNIGTRNEGTSRSLGSGFVISPEGLVVTNNHVVERAHEIEVHLSDARSFEATLVGRDPSTDLALLRLTGAEGLPTVELGDSDQLEVGDWVVAIGNPFGLDTSVTHGLISANERVLGLGPYDDFIQTNALINPGNSGGPLFDMKGAVVGVTTAVVSQGQGIGFAVPINLVKGLLPNLLDNGIPERGWLGLNVQEGNAGQAQSPVVVDVFEASPALKAGIRPGDKVLAVAGRPVQRYQQILRRVALLAPGTSVKLELERAGKLLEVTAVLAERPAAEASRAIASGRVDPLGLVLKVLDPGADPGAKEGPGLKVEALVPGSAGEAAGLVAGDVLIEANRARVATLEELEAALAQYGKNDVVLLRVRRGDSLRYVAVKPRN